MRPAPQLQSRCCTLHVMCTIINVFTFAQRERESEHVRLIQFAASKTTRSTSILCFRTHTHTRIKNTVCTIWRLPLSLFHSPKKTDYYYKLFTQVSFPLQCNIMQPHRRPPAGRPHFSSPSQQPSSPPPPALPPRPAALPAAAAHWCGWPEKCSA